MEVPPGFEPGIRVLQTHALPLGYGTKLNLINVFTQYIYARGLKIVLFYSKILKLLCNKGHLLKQRINTCISFV